MENQLQQILLATSSAVQHLTQVVAAQELQGREARGESKMRELKYFNNFSGTGDVTLAAFIQSMERWLRTLGESHQELGVSLIFHEKIVGEAKNAVINVNPIEWESIKSCLKKRYKPKTKPDQILDLINDIKVSNVKNLIEKTEMLRDKIEECKIFLFRIKFKLFRKRISGNNKKNCTRIIAICFKRM